VVKPAGVVQEFHNASGEVLILLALTVGAVEE
jgi:hypothetical protein